MSDEERRQPLPSEDTGDRTETPASGMTDDLFVAREEGVPYDPPNDRVLSESRLSEGGPDVAGAADDPGERLASDDTIQAPEGTVDQKPRDEALAADVVAALRASDLPAGERLRVSVSGATVVLRGEVESITVMEEILGLVGDVDGVEEVVDEVEITGA